VPDGASAANDINDAGLIVGWGTTQDELDWPWYQQGPYRQPFIYDSAAANPAPVWLNPLDAPGGGNALAVNNAGEVVGELNGHAFHYHNGVLTDLNDVIQSGTGWELGSATDINDSGEIVGVGGGGPFLLTPVHKWVRDRRLESLIQILFGITSDGGGLGVTPGGKPVPVDPLGWRSVPPAQRDARVRQVLRELADLVDDPALRHELERLGLPGIEVQPREGEPE
jgi:probable HAF family extracellular repeat protein